MRWVTVLLIAGALMATTGCLDQDFGDLVGSTEREDEELLDYTDAFSYSGILDPDSPPGGPEDAYQRGTTTFEVPDDSRDLDVEYEITFESGDQAPPQELQEVTLTLDGPSGDENESVTASSPANGAWSFAEPSSGTWTLSYEARGQGEITVTANAQVPSDA